MVGVAIDVSVSQLLADRWHEAQTKQADVEVPVAFVDQVVDHVNSDLLLRLAACKDDSAPSGHVVLGGQCIAILRAVVDGHLAAQISVNAYDGGRHLANVLHDGVVARVKVNACHGRIERCV